MLAIVDAAISTRPSAPRCRRSADSGAFVSENGTAASLIIHSPALPPEQRLARHRRGGGRPNRAGAATGVRKLADVSAKMQELLRISGLIGKVAQFRAVQEVLTLMGGLGTRFKGSARRRLPGTLTSLLAGTVPGSPR